MNSRQGTLTDGCQSNVDENPWKKLGGLPSRNRDGRPSRDIDVLLSIKLNRLLENLNGSRKKTLTGSRQGYGDVKPSKNLDGKPPTYLTDSFQVCVPTELVVVP